MSNKMYINAKIIVWDDFNEKELNNNSTYGCNLLETLTLDTLPIGFYNFSLKKRLEESCLDSLGCYPEKWGNLLLEEGFSSKGIYELTGIYSEEWYRCSYEYEEYDCDWDIEDISITQYNEKNCVEYLNEIYRYEEDKLQTVIEAVDILNLNKYLKKSRRDRSDIYDLLDI